MGSERRLGYRRAFTLNDAFLSLSLINRHQNTALVSFDLRRRRVFAQTIKDKLRDIHLYQPNV
jgi:hypothetical protein